MLKKLQFFSAITQHSFWHSFSRFRNLITDCLSSLTKSKFCASSCKIAEISSVTCMDAWCCWCNHWLNQRIELTSNSSINRDSLKTYNLYSSWRISFKWRSSVTFFKFDSAFRRNKIGVANILNGIPMGQCGGVENSPVKKRYLKYT